MRLTSLDPIRALRTIKELPPVMAWRRARAHDRFLSKDGFASYDGVYATFAEARAALPPSPEFDAESFARDYLEHRTDRIFPYDYPVMWWLRDALAQGASSVFDIGGSVGVHYLAYRRYLEFPTTLRWLVSEVPATVRVGRELSEQLHTPSLSFTDEADPALVDADIWLSAGALQYIESAPGLGPWLKASRRRPQHVLLNKLPLCSGAPFVTTQNIGGGAFAPHHVFNRAQFTREIEAAGYRLVDSWEVPERELRLFGDPQHSFGPYSGLYFMRNHSSS